MDIKLRNTIRFGVLHLRSPRKQQHGCDETPGAHLPLAASGVPIQLRAHDPGHKAELLKAEERWIRIAQGYEMTETLESFGVEVRHLGGK